MSVIPKVKFCDFLGGEVNLNKINWIFDKKTDERVINEAYSVASSDKEGISVYIHTDNTSAEDYCLKIEENRVEINADGANGAFYALQTLKQLLNENNGVIKCRVINDSPDMGYRGFYHDVTRGKIPTIASLKEIADMLALCKINSLQLYIEHSFEFEEYKGCRDELGYLTKEEIREFEAYCHSKFIELIPSISTFGHLYHLLSDEKYKHLSELPDYEPKEHYWKERMEHHTINPTLDESFEVVKSLIDQYLEVTTSDKFNICCDETFDLGNGVNKGKDKAELYVVFVKKIAEYLISKGKTVMMWEDIILQHPECLAELPEDIIFLNWNYDENPSDENFKKIYESGKRQIACPGTSSWASFAEDAVCSEGNIKSMAKYAYKYDAVGLLNTNWGDYGNVANMTVSSYGLILGGAVSWNKDTAVDEKFREEASQIIYGNTEFVKLLAELKPERQIVDWKRVVLNKKSDISFDEYDASMQKLINILQRAQKLTYLSEIVKREAINALGGFVVTEYICAKIDGYMLKIDFDFDGWLKEFEKLWLEKNKTSELYEAIRIIKVALQD